MRRTAVVLLAAAALAGCGSQENRDVPGFIAQGKTPVQRSILGTIATYRTTDDAKLACTLVTQTFLDRRFEHEARNCQQVVRTASRHLPDSARVVRVIGDSARVFVDEPTATRSYYEMRREDGIWKIDDIVDAS